MDGSLGLVDGTRCIALMNRNPAPRQALENYENGVLTKPKEVSPWWLRYSLVLFEEQQVGGWVLVLCAVGMGWAHGMNE